MAIINFNLTRDLSNRHKLFSVIVAEYASFKADLLQFNMNFF